MKYTGIVLVSIMGMFTIFGMDIKKEIGAEYWLSRLGRRTAYDAGALFTETVPELHQLVLVKDGNTFRVGSVEEMHQELGMKYFLIKIIKYIKPHTVWYVEGQVYQLPNNEFVLEK